jgi:hypothetical protein
MTTLSLSQTPDPLNLVLRQNQEWAITFSYCNNDANGNPDLNNPISLAGYTPLLQFRTSALARTAALSLTVGNGLTFNATTCPQVQVSAGIAVAPGKYEWDLRMIPADATESIFLGAGVVQVEAEVSRA